VIEAYVALGSNLGDRLGNLAQALELIEQDPAFFVRAVSRAWETEPVGPPQPRYLNAAVCLGTLVTPRATLLKLLAIEEKMGRVRRERWGARDIDLDLLLFGDRIAVEGALKVPHPMLHERTFVLAPLAEIAPRALHAGLGLTIAELLAQRPQAERDGVQPYRAIPRALPESEPADGERS
jgi:2-amino-4-hydroxy-6-hydroxymethyldihydropteridine diphosphokinase